MKKSKILKELKEIKELIGDNRVSAWNEDLSNSSDAVLLEDMTDKYGEEVEAKYNGWNEKLEKLIAELEGEKEPTRMDVMVTNFYEYIAMDDATEKDVIAEIESLQTHRQQADEHDTLDHVLSDKFCPVACFEHTFTVGEFLNHIDTKGYE